MQTRERYRKTHQTIAKITSDFEQLHLNTSVAALMELFNQIGDFNRSQAIESEDVFEGIREALESLVIMLTPLRLTSRRRCGKVWDTRAAC